MAEVRESGLAFHPDLLRIPKNVQFSPFLLWVTLADMEFML